MNELLDEVWPTFLDDAGMQVATIGEGVLALAVPPEQRRFADTLRTVRRAAHSLKGAAAALELDDYATAAHHIEDLLHGFSEGDVLPASVVGKTLSAVAVLERALEAQQRVLGDALTELVSSTPTPPPISKEPAAAVPEALLALEALVTRVCSAGADVSREASQGRALVDALRAGFAVERPKAQAVLERLDGAFEALASGADDPSALVRLAGWVVDLGDALAEKRVQQAVDAALEPVPVAPLRMVRVSEPTLDELDRQVDAFIFGARRQQNEAAALRGLVRSLQAAQASCRQTQIDLRHQGVSVPPSLDEVATALRHVEHQLSRSTRELLRGSEQLSLSTSAAREHLRQMRLTPARAVLEGLRRAAFELASRLGKQVEVTLDGADLALDRHLLDTVREPLLHLVRNAIDHGLESPEERRSNGKSAGGVVQLSVTRRGPRVVIVVEDDGRGLSPAAIRSAAVRKGLVPAARADAMGDDEAAQLIFLPGFSTASQITTTSGRGVGLDVVSATVQQLQGSIVPTWTAGRGTRFSIDLPLSVSTSWVLLARSAGQRVAVPTDAIERMGRIAVGGLRHSTRSTVTIDQDVLPCRTLASAWGSDAPPAHDPSSYVVLNAGGQRAVIVVDELSSHHEVVVQALGRRAAGATHLAGAAVLDDGSVVGVVSPAVLLRTTGVVDSPAVRRPKVLVVDDSLTTRAVMRGLISSAGFDVIAASDGEEALTLLDSEGADLVVSDVEMPRLDGLSLCRRVRQDDRWAALPVVLVTSLDAEADRAAGTDAGANAYLVKREVVKGELLALVRQLTSERFGKV